jgi:hypothetical protein
VLRERSAVADNNRLLIFEKPDGGRGMIFLNRMGYQGDQEGEVQKVLTREGQGLPSVSDHTIRNRTQEGVIRLLWRFGEEAVKRMRLLDLASVDITDWDVPVWKN